MRILFVSSVYPPETGPGAARMKYLSEGLAARGHEVTVIAGFPNYPTGRVPADYRWKLARRFKLPNGIRLIRVYEFARPRRRFRQRIVGELSLLASAFIAAFFTRPRPDVIVTTSPPFFYGLSALFAAGLRRIPFVFEVRDLYPETAIALDAVRNPLLIKVLKRIERCYYRGAVRVVGVTRGVCRGIEQAAGNADKARLIYNGVDSEFFRPSPPDDALVEEYGLRGKFVVLYVGGMLLGGGLETLLDTAAILKDRSEIHFLLVGDGTMKEALLQKARELQLDNVTFIGQQPRDRVPRFMSLGQVAVVPVDDVPLFQGAMPSKIFEYMASGLPVINQCDGEARQMLREARAGLYVPPENPEAFRDVILALQAAPDECAALGQRAREHVARAFSSESTVMRYEELLRETSSNASRPNGSL